MSQVSGGRSIISVACYHNDSEVLEYAKQLEKQKSSEKIILLVSANEADNYELLAKQLDSISIECHLYNAGKNLGYLNGCLYGIKQFSDLRDEDTIVISNTDLTFEDKDIFYQILQKMEDSRIWCLGPSIRLVTGRYQNPFQKERPSSKKVYSWKKIQSNAFLLTIYTFFSKIKNEINKKTIPDESGNIYAAHGSFFALNTRCLMELLKVSDNIFMYGEELLVAEIVRENNKLVLYDSEIHITHNENSTTGLANTNAKAGWYQKSLDYIYSHYFS